MKNLLLFAALMIGSFSLSFGQCINNPSLQQGDIDPAPLTNGAGGIISFSYFENLLDYNDNENNPVSITVCLLNVEPVGGAAAVNGSFAPVFTWTYDAISNCLQGTQNADILGGTGGKITIAFDQTNAQLCPDNQMGFNANLQPAACMNQVNQTTDDTESVYTCTTGPLPIELSSFEGKVADCRGLLTWTTQSEVDFSHFELEKSDDGVSFKTIETFQGKGTDNSGATYTYTDNNLRFVNLYRLKMVDLDGSLAYSKLVSLERDCGESQLQFEVYPNPVNEQINIELTSENSSGVEIQVLDMLGRVLISENANLTPGKNIKTINTKALSAATYYIQLTNDAQVTNGRKFIKIVD